MLNYIDEKISIELIMKFIGIDKLKRIIIIKKNLFYVNKIF